VRKLLEEGVRVKYGEVEAVEVPIKPYAPPTPIASNRQILIPTTIYDRGRDHVGLHAGEIVKMEGKMTGEPSREQIASGEGTQQRMQ
jgi:hypothetical protein